MSRIWVSAAAVVLLVAGVLVGASPARSASSTVTVATFNVCKVDCAAPAPSWEVRRERVARLIGESGADVVGLQEATNWSTAQSRTQVEDIAKVTAPFGYSLPVIPDSANECRRPRDERGQLAGPSPCDNTAAVLFRPASLPQVVFPDGRASAGIVMASTVAAGLDPRAAVRSVAWAFLQGPAGPFLVVSAHADNSKDPVAEASRVAFGRGLRAWVEAHTAANGLAGVPVVLLADLNSYAKRQPAGVQAVLAAAGWVDAFSARSRRNIQFSTINYNPLLTDAQGFPARPYVFRKSKRNKLGAATRIDYVFSLGAVRPLDYEVVVRLRPDGSFDPEYQASDHQMVRAVLGFGPPR